MDIKIQKAKEKSDRMDVEATISYLLLQQDHHLQVKNSIIMEIGREYCTTNNNSTSNNLIKQFSYEKIHVIDLFSSSFFGKLFME